MVKLNILHLANFVGRRSFGIGPIVLGLASSQQALGHNVSICSLDVESEARKLENMYHLGAGTIQTFPIVGPSRLACSPWMEQHVLAHATEYDVVHVHGIWTYTSHIVNRWRKERGGPTIVAPHGSLDPWALKRSKWKKRLALSLYESENLYRASCLHALSHREADSFRTYGLSNPIAIIPNGISNNWLASTGDGQAFRRKFSIPQYSRLILFLGRISPIKNLPMLLEAIASLRKDLYDWKLVIAGVDEFGHEKEVRDLVERLDLSTYVYFVCPLYGTDKRNSYEAADIFVLPSYTENFGNVVAEALGAGVPVIASKGTPWEELGTNNCGWWTEISIEGISNALREALSKSSEELKIMGMNGKKLISEKYTWDKIGIMIIQLYLWLLGVSDKPEFVI